MIVYQSIFSDYMGCSHTFVMFALNDLVQPLANPLRCPLLLDLVILLFKSRKLLCNFISENASCKISPSFSPAQVLFVCALPNRLFWLENLMPLLFFEFYLYSVPYSTFSPFSSISVSTCVIKAMISFKAAKYASFYPNIC